MLFLLLFVFNGIIYSQTPKTFEDWYYLGRDQVAAKKFDEAINSYSQAIKLKPEGSAAYIRRGEAYSFLNNDSLALKDLNKAIKLSPNVAETYLLRGLVYLATQKFELAKADFTKNIELGGTMGSRNEGYYYRSLVYLGLNDAEHAIADLSKAIEQSEGEELSRYLYEKGKIYFSLQKYELAIADFSASIKVDSSHKAEKAITYFSRGTSYLNINKLDEGIKDLTKALQLDPTDIRSLFYRSIAYCAAGKKDLAKADEKKVVEMGGKLDAPCQ